MHRFTRSLSFLASPLVAWGAFAESAVAQGSSGSPAPPSAAASAAAEAQRNEKVVGSGLRIPQPYDKEQVAALFAWVDRDAKGWVSYRDVMVQMSVERGEFQVIDRSGDGRVDLAEFDRHVRILLDNGGVLPMLRPAEKPATEAAAPKAAPSGFRFDREGANTGTVSPVSTGAEKIGIDVLLSKAGGAAAPSGAPKAAGGPAPGPAPGSPPGSPPSGAAKGAGSPGPGSLPGPKPPPLPKARPN